MKTNLILAATLSLPALATAAVDFVKDVQPILEYNCVRCHNEKATAVEKGDTDYLLVTAKGAIRGKYIIPGNGEKSKIYTTTIAPDTDDKLMPPLDEIKKGASNRLTKEQTTTLKTWIDEGAKWPEDITLRARKQGDARYPKDTPVLVNEIHARIAAFTKEKTEKEMKPYSTNVIGTEVMFEMLPIPGGKFKMGSPETEKGHKPDEGPQKEVSVEPFWMGKTEVSWNEFQLFMYPEEDKKTREGKQLTVDQSQNVTASDAVTHPTPPYVEMSFGMGTDGFPAISMTQHAANKYCEWLSARTGHFYRLPTEAEWEYAARAGTTTAYYWGDDASKLNEYEWSSKNAALGYAKIAKKKPNPWGLYDILGNVAEWTLDQYSPDFYSKMPAENPWNRATLPYPQSVRGGSWDDMEPEKFRAAVRRASGPEWKVQDPQLPKSYWYHTNAQFLGFRIVRPLKTPTAEEMGKYWNSGVEKDDPRMEKTEK
jgi:formylglycine-generating enzyme required for sulfatase activity